MLHHLVSIEVVYRHRSFYPSFSHTRLSSVAAFGWLASRSGCTMCEYLIICKIALLPFRNSTLFNKLDTHSLTYHFEIDIYRSLNTYNRIKIQKKAKYFIFRVLLNSKLSVFVSCLGFRSWLISFTKRRFWFWNGSLFSVKGQFAEFCSISIHFFSYRHCKLAKFSLFFKTSSLLQCSFTIFIEFSEYKATLCLNFC